MFPSILNTFNRPSPTDRLNSPSHSALHNTVSSAVGQIETFLGKEGASSTVGTLLYDIRSPDSGGGGHIQSANKGGTGQTTYTKGDLLVATSTSVIAKLAVGSDGQGLISDSSYPSGVKWSGVSQINTTSIMTTSVWSRPSTATLFFVEVWAGGGSGGAHGQNGRECGGGGGGGYFNCWIPFSKMPSSVLAVVGLGGSAVSSSIGVVGGTTHFGSILQVFGGGPGDTSTTNATGGGGGNWVGPGTSTGLPGGGTPFASIFGGGTTGLDDGLFAIYGGMGGFGSLGGGGRGGITVNGGGGGGGAGGTVAGTGGVSLNGGNGGSASIVGIGATPVSILGGSVPGGGGGALYGNGSSGSGGNGKINITTFI